MSKQTAALHAPADFGLAIQQARLDRGMSQQQLATQLAVPQSTISEIEAGKSTIYLRRLLSLARATGIEFTATWGGDDAPRG
ncbi:helix-turn-helix domain-containing protein [Demequina lutea]|uniref:Transcriptional regulator with XRE-family HTH domain n=1 Tax=Demequina lutea TaxID=431489 RepID=A0A7Z0CH48_9MICO|nr:helix-turn-helix transcriptional regulator [Demequina lutea]NYI40454.1 transcriptional regulator with XRE-family HTH domain [Demequina lutea]